MRAFLAFTYLSKSHAWRGSPSWYRGPPLLDGASQPKTCLFNLVAGESHPSRLRASISSLVTASASQLPSFTFPSLPVRQWVLISHRTPVRAPRPGDLTSSTPRPARLTHPDREYFPPVGCWREPPGHTACFLSLPVQHSESWSPVGRRRELPGQTTLPFKPVAQRGLPVRHGDSETSRTSARASGTNSLTFSNLLLDQAYPSDTAILKPVGRRREPPGQTTFLFHPAAGKAYPTTLPVDCEAFRPSKLCLSV